MTAKNFTFVIRSNSDFQPWISGARGHSVNKLINYLSSLAGGTRSGAVTLEARNTAVAATGAVVVDTSGGGNSGSKSITINGVASSATWTTSDNNTAQLLAAAINANSDNLISKNVSAACSKGTVTISSGSGAIVATINGVAISVTWATSDNNTASLLATAINASPNAAVYGIFTASANSGTVTITGTSGTTLTLSVTGTGATTTSSVVVTATHPGYTGNATTLSTASTGLTASGARLTGGSTDAVDSVVF